MVIYDIKSTGKLLVIMSDFMSDINVMMSLNQLFLNAVLFI